jgi:hypothetical protein
MHGVTKASTTSIRFRNKSRMLRSIDAGEACNSGNFPTKMTLASTRNRSDKCKLQSTLRRGTEPTLPRERPEPALEQCNRNRSHCCASNGHRHARSVSSF